MVLPDDGSLPAHRVLATGKPVFVETPADYERVAPGAFPSAQEIGRVDAFAALPVVLGGEPAGVLALSFKGEHTSTSTSARSSRRSRAAASRRSSARSSTRRRPTRAPRRSRRAGRRTSFSRCSGTSCATLSRRSSPRSI
jgi:hypothetical protein